MWLGNLNTHTALALLQQHFRILANRERAKEEERALKAHNAALKPQPISEVRFKLAHSAAWPGPKGLSEVRLGPIIGWLDLRLHGGNNTSLG